MVRFVLLVLLFGFVVHCIISTIVVAFEISIYLYLSVYSVVHCTSHDLCEKYREDKRRVYACGLPLRSEMSQLSRRDQRSVSYGQQSVEMQ